MHNWRIVSFDFSLPLSCFPRVKFYLANGWRHGGKSSGFSSSIQSLSFELAWLLSTFLGVRLASRVGSYLQQLYSLFITCYARSFIKCVSQDCHFFHDSFIVSFFQCVSITNTFALYTIVSKGNQGDYADMKAALRCCIQLSSCGLFSFFFIELPGKDCSIVVQLFMIN